MLEHPTNRKHDLLWAALTVAGFGLLLAVVALLLLREPSTEKVAADLLAEAQSAIQAGDRAAADDSENYLAARENYQQALDLLLPLDDDCQALKADIHLRIARTFYHDGNYPAAQRELDFIRHSFPQSAADPNLATLTRDLQSRLANSPAP